MTNNTVPKKLTIVLLLLAALAVLSPGTGTVRANGGTRPLVTNQTVGPYKLQVGIFPGKPRVGNLHLSIIVEDAADGKPLTATTVFVSLTGPSEATSVGPVAAKNTPQNPQFYDADLPLDMIGSWTLTLETNGNLGKASLDVPLEVAEPEGLDLILLLAGAVAIVAIVLWIKWRIGNDRSRSGS